jgi:hypothetical protein
MRITGRDLLSLCFLFFVALSFWLSLRELACLHSLSSLVPSIDIGGPCPGILFGQRKPGDWIMRCFQHTQHRTIAMTCVDLSRFLSAQGLALLGPNPGLTADLWSMYLCCYVGRTYIQLYCEASPLIWCLTARLVKMIECNDHRSQPGEAGNDNGAMHQLVTCAEDVEPARPLTLWESEDVYD